MTTECLPWPVPDPRTHYFVSQYADMHALVEDLVVPGGVPAAAASVLTAARELLRHAYFQAVLDGRSLAGAVISGGAASGAGVLLFHQIIA